MNKKAYGFTIVELLIVIVVIGILATITVITYTGLTNQAHDVAVKSDLSNFNKKIQVFLYQKKRYPDGEHVDIELDSLEFRATKDSYDLSGSNLMYCHEDYDIAYGQQYILSAVSKSGKVYILSSSEGMKEASAMFTACDRSPYTSYYRGFAPEDFDRGPWRSWAGDN